MNDIVYLKDNRGQEDFDLFYQCTFFLTGMEYFDTGSSGQGWYVGAGTGAVIEGDLDIARTERILKRLFNEIDSLRVCYPAHEGDPYHFKIRAELDFTLEVLEAQGETFQERVDFATQQESRIVADLGNYTDRACRAVVYDLKTSDSGKPAWLLALTFNHMIVDDQGLILVWDQFMRYYRGEDKQVANAHSLIDYFNYMNDHPDLYDAAQIRSYWARELEGYATPKLTEPEGPAGFASFNLDDYVVNYDIAHLKRVAKACRVTLPALFVAAFHIASARTFGTRDSVVTLGSEARPSFEFWTTVVHSLVSINNRMDVRDDEKFVDFARRTMAKMSENIKNAPAQEYVGGISHLGISYANQPAAPDLGEGLECRQWIPVTVVDDNRTEPKEEVLPPVQLMMGIVEYGDIVRTQCGFSPLSFSMADAKGLSDGIKHCLDVLDQDRDVTVSKLLSVQGA